MMRAARTRSGGPLNSRRIIAVAGVLGLSAIAFSVTRASRRSAEAELQSALERRARAAAVDAADALTQAHQALGADASAISAVPALQHILPLFSAATLGDNLATEPWSVPYRARDPLLGVIWPGDGVVHGTQLSAPLRAALLDRAHRQGPFTTLALVEGNPYLLAGAPVSVHPAQGKPGEQVSVLVLAGRPVDTAVLGPIAGRAAAALVLAGGGRPLVNAGKIGVQPAPDQLPLQRGQQAHDPAWRWTAAARQVGPDLALWAVIDTSAAAATALGAIRATALGVWGAAAALALVALGLGFRRGTRHAQPPELSNTVLSASSPAVPLAQTHVSQPQIPLSGPPATAAPIALDVPAPQAGQVFGRYVLVDRLGAGGMGEVYLAVVLGAEGFRRNFVVKRLRPDLASTPNLVAHFIDEARLGSKLVHANIVPVFDFGKVGDAYFMAQEYIDGRDLERLTAARIARDGRALPAHLVLYAAHQVLLALAYAHAKQDDAGQPLGLVHRDVSPQNVLVSSRGEVRLFDFGIVKSADKAVQTEAGVVKGNVSYMSPEQARGAEVDARADLFSLGLAIYRCVSGRALYQEVRPYDRLMHAGQGPSDDDWAKIDALPSEVSAVLRRALAADPAQRFQSAQAFAAALPAPQPGHAAELAAMVEALFGGELQAERDKLNQVTVGGAGQAGVGA